MLRTLLSKHVLILALVALLSGETLGQSSKSKGEGKTMKNPVVVEMKTSVSDELVEIELYPDKAPESVSNFLKYVEDGFYNDTIFHRVIAGFMIQGGGFSKDLKKKDTRAPIQNEAKNGLKNDRGTIAMARTPDIHSATAQFYINAKDNDFLNYRSDREYGYAVFGKVISGMSVVESIENARTQTSNVGGQPMPDVPVTSIVIERISLKK